MIFRGTVQKVQCPPPQSPAPLVAADPYQKPDLGLISPTLHSCAALKHLPEKMRMNKIAHKQWGGARPHGNLRMGRQKSSRSWSTGNSHHRSATRRSLFWPHKRTITAQTPLVQLRPWPLRQLWPAVWDGQTPSALPARVCELAGSFPTDTFGNVWHRQPRLQAVILSVTQRRMIDARATGDTPWKRRGNPREV